MAQGAVACNSRVHIAVIWHLRGLELGNMHPPNAGKVRLCSQGTEFGSFKREISAQWNA